MRGRKKEAAAAGLAASTLALLGAGIANRTTTTTTSAEPATEPAPAAQPDADLLRDVIPRQWDLPSERNERVDFFIDFLKGERYDDMQQWMERVGRYGPMIRQELRARGMPEDLLFLAMIESGLDPNAYSSADAAGIWQFIAPTARRYGLEVSRYVDERRDPVKSTDAALSYLQDLHDRFGSYFLAAASYNTGENRVGRIMRSETGSERGTDADYWQIGDRLPRETRDYVPLMLAAAHIAKDPGAYGFPRLQFEQPLRFDQVAVPGGTKLDAVAEAAGVPVSEVVDLNPQLVRKETPPRREWSVRIPEGTAGTFAANFSGTGTGGTLAAE